MVRTITRAAVGGYLKTVRLPFDAAARVAGGDGSSGVGLALDRAEAAARDVAGLALRDPKLREDARRRRIATDERTRALRLRAEAEQHEEVAEERLDEGRRRAASTRSRTARQAQQTKQQGDSRRREAREPATE